jgi:hypothetical protein
MLHVARSDLPLEKPPELANANLPPVALLFPVFSVISFRGSQESGLNIQAISLFVHSEIYL